VLRQGGVRALYGGAAAGAAACAADDMRRSAALARAIRISACREGSRVKGAHARLRPLVCANAQ
jgi:hypothetical protein